ncbi:MAG: UDP-2,4-diacetamido-2,4,6-trideoxy-beta-L-altropyranose hydrolase, partial [Candidatus Omnitrophica bacterium]|nr:UDP-2,4-diacetamido-2,4,6-trideoxy-beta-L-altropyranose hydrolase [Candidatus Omnitrophota bacterium]MBU1808944.1 UDP-2,4-diacetamido-2,4,6-trideoxy-beta-L-altropyranose hydrolase [Candidatus Omnitrophota bacterium]
MKIFIITEGGRSIGFGHIARSVSLYQAFEEKGQRPLLLVNGDETAAYILSGRNFDIVDWMNSKKELFARIAGADIVIVDSYYPDIDFYDRVSKLAKVPVYMDDNKRVDYSSGVVVNGNIYAN